MYNQPNHWQVMLDIETLGTSVDSAVTAIGAVAFNPHTLELCQNTFYQPIAIADAMKYGNVDGNTLDWWFRQSNEATAMYRLPPEKYVTTPTALQEFKDWAYQNLCVKDHLTVWGNGAAFDNVIMHALFKKVTGDTAWHFWNDRCYRTIKAMHPTIKASRIGVHHNAMEDALTQAVHLLEILKYYRGNPPS